MNQGRDGASSDEKLESLRERLYERGVKDEHRERIPFTPLESASAPTVWPQETHHKAPAREQYEPVLSPKALPLMTERIPITARRKRVRMLTLVGAGIFFVLAVILAGAFILFGGNSISGKNITLDVHGPFAIGGGEELPLTISITNQNSVPIESATLIISYPSGTQSITQSGKELLSERKVIDHIDPGSTINVQTSAAVFGEENEEKEVKVSIDYRVQGSNATFYKDAPPLRFKISSSPVTVLVEAVNKVSSGQNVDFTLTLTSNSPTPLTDLLVTAVYPEGFDFTSATVKPVTGESVWRIDSLKPEEKQVIKITGLMTGQNAEERAFKFSAGISNDRNRFELASVFTTKTHTVTLEEAFVNLVASVNGKVGNTIVVNAKESASVEIAFTNTLSSALYDGVIEVQLGGNALDKSKVLGGQGYYNSNDNTILWDKNSMPELREIASGKKSTVSFTFTPSIDQGGSRTPQVEFEVNVKGKRVREENVSEELIGTASSIVKVESVTALSADGIFSFGPFNNQGPLPPVAEVKTEYGILLTAQNGSNAVTGATVETTLPPYVTWLDVRAADTGTIKYNASSRVVTWAIGDMPAGTAATAAFQISFLPSVSLVDSVPALTSVSRYKATDKFTGTVLRASAPEVTTELKNDPRPDAQDGKVRPSDSQ